MEPSKKLGATGLSNPNLVGFVTMHHQLSTPLDDIAEMLNVLGYTSGDGLRITKDHVSNFERKQLKLRRVKLYIKPNYTGLNHETVAKLKKAGLWEWWQSLENTDETIKTETQKELKKSSINTTHTPIEEMGTQELQAELSAWTQNCKEYSADDDALEQISRLVSRSSYLGLQDLTNEFTKLLTTIITIKN